MSEPQPNPDASGTDPHLKSGTPAQGAPAANADAGFKYGLPPLSAAGADDATVYPPIAYQPISGWAIAGFATSCLFALLVAISAVFAFFQGAPVFFPIWIIGIALLGMGLSHFGQRHVQTSEGTRAGASLARWGFRLSLVSALAYTSYYYVTGLAIHNQANAFVMEMGDDAGFFPRLQSGDRKELNTVFLLAQAPNARGSARPDDERSMRAAYDRPTKDGTSGQLTVFREGLQPMGTPVRESLSRILYKQLGKEAVITPLSVLDWRYEKHSYKVYRIYHIKTKELELDYALAVFSLEAEDAGQTRKWFVNLLESGPVGFPKRTPTGEGIVRLHEKAHAWLNERFRLLKDENKAFANPQKLDNTPWDVLQIDNGKPDERAERRRQIHQVLAAEGDLTFQRFDIANPPSQAGRWEQVDGKIRVTPMIRFVLGRAKHQLPIYQFDILTTLESTQAIDPATFGPASAVEWNLIAFEVTAASGLTDPKKLLEGPGPQSR